MAHILAVRSRVMATLDAVMSYDNSAVVARFVDKLDLDEFTATELFGDLKRFMYLCGMKQKGDPTLAPPDQIDKAWHEFILFTEDYAAFCHDHFGRFIHHRPRRPEDPLGDGEVMRNTRGVALATFNQLSRNWSTGERDDCNLNCTYDPCTLSTNCQDE